METLKIIDLISDKISGEWGETDSFSSTSVNVIRTTNFTNSGEIIFEDIVKREVDPKKVKRKKLLDGDIIIEKSGGSPNQPVGRVVYFKNPTGEDYICNNCLLYTSPSPRDRTRSRMPSSA